MSVFSFGAKDNRISMYAVADKLEESGWHVDRLQRPESIHVIINAGHGEVVDKYLADLRGRSSTWWRIRKRRWRVRRRCTGSSRRRRCGGW